LPLPIFAKRAMQHGFVGGKLLKKQLLQFFIRMGYINRAMLAVLLSACILK
jgi:hypothetical protein